MITLSYEALIALVALCGGAGYMLGRQRYTESKKVTVLGKGTTVTF